MGCGKSKQSVATDNSALRKGEIMNADSRTGGEVRFEPFPDEIVEAKAREVDGEDLKTETRGERDDADAEALPRPEDATESREMLLSPPGEGTEHEEEDEKKEETLEEEEDAALEENKDASLEDKYRDGNGGSARRLISRDSPDHYFSSRKDDEALEGILSEYNSPILMEANKPSQEVPAEGDLKAKEEAILAEPTIGSAEPKAVAAYHSQTNPAPRT